MEGSGVARCNDCGHIGGHHPWCGEKWREEKPVNQYPNTPRMLDTWQKPSFTTGYDAVNPPHYSRRAIEPWDYVAANKLGYFEGNAIKYITRWRDKNGLTDIRKAIRFLEKLIAVEEKLVRDAGQDIGGQPATGDTHDRADPRDRT